MGVTTRGLHYPEPTDLVTDGATAMQTLAEDTDGQLDALAAAIAGGDALAIAKALVDAKGDLIVGTADDAPDRLAVGTDGQVLTADSTQAAGVKWATPSAGGAMINQTIRGTIVVPAGALGSNTDVTIAAVNTAKTQLRLLAAPVTYAPAASSGGPQVGPGIRLLLQSSTKVRVFNDVVVPASWPVQVSYELTEWT